MARRMLEVRKVTQFDLHAPGWAEWHAGAIRGPKDEFSFFENDEEVARARIYPEYHLHVPYEGLRQGLFVDIDLVVVRGDRRGAGIGPDVVALLVSHYQGQEMIAFSATPHNMEPSTEKSQDESFISSVHPLQDGTIALETTGSTSISVTVSTGTPSKLYSL